MELKHMSYLYVGYFAKSFGLTPSGEDVCIYELCNKNGMKLQITNYGATITSLKIPLTNGEIIDVVLGFNTLENYINSFDLESPPYFGATIGRFAGRISEGKFSIDKKKYCLNKNNNNHSLHGGNIGFSQKVWKVINSNSDKNPSITLLHFSPDNDENFPGNLNVTLTYTLTEENELTIDYQAFSSEDTIINLTHHSYFNLDGHQNDIKKLDLFINSKKILETTDENIPTGRYNNIANCPFDFTTQKKCPYKIDTTFILDKQTKLAASVFSIKNNLKMEVYTNQPAVHIYVGGNCFGKLKGKENANYHSTSGICFETQNFPNAPNHEHFPSSILKKDAVYNHTTTYKFETF